MSYYFFYGTLLDRDVFFTVLLRDQDELFERDLTVKNFSRFKVEGEEFPVLLPELNNEVEGKIFRIPHNLIERLHFFEDVGFDFKVKSFEFSYKNNEVFYFSPTSELKVMKTYWNYDEFQEVKEEYVKSCFKLMKEMKYLE